MPLEVNYTIILNQIPYNQQLVADSTYQQLVGVQLLKNFICILESMISFFKYSL